MICSLSFGVFMFALRSNGQAIMFYSCDLFIIYYGRPSRPLYFCPVFLLFSIFVFFLA